MTGSSAASRDVQVRRVLVCEGAANVLALGAKLAVGLTTQSTAILSDALHSLTDLANNALAWGASRISSEPPDENHPYGHRKFESLAVFVLATLLGVLALEIAIRAIDRFGQPVAPSRWGLLVMIGVLVLNVVVTSWQHFWALRLNSDLLRADARHTLADVLVTTAVIVGWQLAARGYPAIDMAFALLVAGIVLYLAWGLFRRAMPTLVDEVGIDSQRLRRTVQRVPGVHQVRRLRSRTVGSEIIADVVVTVDGRITTEKAHEIADAIEDRLADEWGVTDVTVHVEPH
ncbi:cation diffusion facilitator family transporter [soil metagenome]